MLSKKTTIRLLVSAIMFPIGLCVTWGTGSLLEAMGDPTWAHVLYRVCLVGGILWLINLIGLLIVVGIHAVVTSDSSEDAPQ